MDNNAINFDNNMLPPAPASVKRDVTVILYNNDYFMNRYDTPPPLDSNTLKLPPVSYLERQTATWIGKEEEPQYSNSFVSTICDNDLPTPIPELTSIDTMAYLKTEEIIHEAYIQELLFCPWLEFKKEDYSGLPYDPIYLTHLNEDIRKDIASKLPQPPKLVRQTNGPSYSGPSILGDDDLDDDMPPTNPVFMRMDSEQHYINPFGRNDSS
jgi:hypothetical protein